MATRPAPAIPRRYTHDIERNEEQASEWISFVLKKPLVALGSAIVMFVLSSGAVLKLLPAAEPIVETVWFASLDPMRNILALGFVVFVGVRRSTTFAGILLSAYFLIHVPYHSLTFPDEVVYGLGMILWLILGTGLLVTIDRLHGATSRAERRARASTHIAMHDKLTDLPNRAFFQEEARRTMAAALRRGTKFAVLFIDLDNFKDVNDALGHAMGDKLLKIVSGRLRDASREGDIVARLGGDEFAIIAKGSEGLDGVINMTRRLIDRVSEPIYVDGQRMHTSPSIGIAPYPCIAETEKVTDVMQLLRHADIAMYQAKNSGGRSFEFFDHEISKGVVEKHAILSDLRYAVERKEMLLYYQPQYDMRSGELVGVEALIRWNHPERGLMVPDEFIPVAESSGVIVPLGEWVLKTATAQNRAWQQEGLRPIKVNVNVSPVQLHGLPIVRGVERILKQVGLDPKYLDLELTENVLMDDVAFSARVLAQLRELGVSLSIDDFGTGYSSLSCLQDFSVDTLKIDKTFVKNISENSNTQAIANAMIKLGHSLGINVIAEGVENESDMELLRTLGCNQGQGYFFSEPLAKSDFSRLLRENSRNITYTSLYSHVAQD